MSPRVSPPVSSPGRFPRVSGDEPLRLSLTDRVCKFSPRERG